MMYTACGFCLNHAVHQTQHRQHGAVLNLILQLSMLGSYYNLDTRRATFNDSVASHIPSAMIAGADNTSHISIALPHSLVNLCAEHNGFDMQSLISSHAELSITQYTCYHITTLFRCDSWYHCVLYITNTPRFGVKRKGFHISWKCIDYCTFCVCHSMLYPG
jgi:hypothetical protein